MNIFIIDSHVFWLDILNWVICVIALILWIYCTIFIVVLIIFIRLIPYNWLAVDLFVFCIFKFNFRIIDHFEIKVKIKLLLKRFQIKR